MGTLICSTSATASAGHPRETPSLVRADLDGNPSPHRVPPNSIHAGQVVVIKSNYLGTNSRGPGRGASRTTGSCRQPGLALPPGKEQQVAYQVPVEAAGHPDCCGRDGSGTSCDRAPPVVLARGAPGSGEMVAATVTSDHPRGLPTSSRSCLTSNDVQLLHYPRRSLARSCRWHSSCKSGYALAIASKVRRRSERSTSARPMRPNRPSIIGS